ncbi:uncharacterized protein LOC107030204 [Solanum pennellii]|uniref:Uncharacterized protein LOC107030204 n=1 Tax=Solanum pennellii TaxID=28526 RepID=A0ABM1HL28_SOLPN|nr:uncharacterized protein LOC107030204 [Solanum pennellii]
MSRFLTGVSYIVKEECCTIMLHGDMTLSRHMVYAQSIEESKLWRRSRDAKRGIFDKQVQPKFMKRAPIQDGSRDPKSNYNRAGGFQTVKPTCASCRKNHFRKCLDGTSGCFSSVKDNHKVRDCPSIAARGREAKQVPPNALGGGV